MGTITVDANSYTVYGDLAAAKLYLAALSTPGAVAWRALTDNEKSRRILGAFLYLESQPWQGEPVNGPRPALQWPRTGVYYADGTTVPSSVIPVEIEYAEYELAAISAANPGVYGQANSGSNVKLVKAGPVEVENFTSTLTNGFATLLPTELDRLVAQFLGSGRQSATRSTVSGACGESHFDDQGCVTRYRRGGPF